MSVKQGFMTRSGDALGIDARVKSRLAPAFLALMLGCFVVGMTGFASIEVIHNAAHDVRHATSFPCH
jgi:cobalt transporter subunit CbtB